MDIRPKQKYHLHTFTSSGQMCLPQNASPNWLTSFFHLYASLTSIPNRSNNWTRISWHRNACDPRTTNRTPRHGTRIPSRPKATTGPRGANMCSTHSKFVRMAVWRTLDALCAWLEGFWVSATFFAPNKCCIICWVLMLCTLYMRHIVDECPRSVRLTYAPYFIVSPFWVSQFVRPDAKHLCCTISQSYSPLRATVVRWHELFWMRKALMRLLKVPEAVCFA